MTAQSTKDYHPMWEKPKHHENATVKSNQVHWIELFYDLIHVVCIFILGNTLAHHLSFEGFALFAGIFSILWMSWGDFAFYNSLYISTDYKHRIMSAFHIVTVMIMAASIPNIMEGGFQYFVLAYALNRAILGILYWRATRHNEISTPVAREMSRNFFILAFLSLITALFPFSIGIWMLGGIMILMQAMYLLPRVGVMRLPDFTPRLHHLSERFSLLLLICLGEGFFKMVLELSGKGISHASWDIFLNYTLGGLGLFMLAWMYFDFAGKWLIKNTEKYTMAQWWYSHMFLMMAAVMIGVALTGEVKVHYYEVYPVKYAILGSAGLILYISSLWSIESTLDRGAMNNYSFAHIRIAGIILTCIALGSVFLGVPSFIGNILYFSALASQLFFPILKGYRVVFGR